MARGGFTGDNFRDVYVARFSGGKVVPGTVRRVASGDGVFTHPAMSPDGSRVAFWGIYEDKIDIWTADIESLEPERLTGGTGSNCHPAWSPDSRRIVFSSDPSYRFVQGKAGIYGAGTGFGRRSLWVADIKTKTRTRLTGGEEDQERPAWSPRGGEIAFAASTGASKHIHVLEIRTGRRKAVTRGAGIFYRPAWHPAGRVIAFNNKGPGTHYIWTAGKEGCRPRRVTPPCASGRAVHDHGSFWSADGRRIFFHSDRAGSPGIWSIDPESGRMNPIPIPGFRRCGHATLDAREKYLSFDSERSTQPHSSEC